MDTEYPKGPAIFRTLLFQLEAGIPGGILGVSRGGGCGRAHRFFLGLQKMGGVGLKCGPLPSLAFGK